MVSDWTKDYQQALKSSAAFGEFFKDQFSEEELAKRSSVIESYSFVLPKKIAEKTRKYRS